MACFKHKQFTDLACIHCVNSERASYNCVLAVNHKVSAVKVSDPIIEDRIKLFPEREIVEVTNDLHCFHTNLPKSCCAHCISGPSKQESIPVKRIAKPETLSVRSSGIKFKSGNYPNSPKFVKDTLALLGSTPDQGLVCSFCNKPVDFILASYGMGSPRQILTREIVGADELGNPIYRQVVKHTSDRLIACPDHVRLIQPIKDKDGKITHSNVHTVSEG